jgi:hypothetical protein
MSNKKTLIAFQIIETGKTNDKGEPINYWNRVGAGWVNKDGSINVQLNAIPMDGKIQLREPKDD